MTSRIEVAGKDCTEARLAQLDALAQSTGLTPEQLRRPAMTLTDCVTESEYLDQLIRLLRDREHLVTTDFEIPHRNTVTGRLWARLKKSLWKVFRYQHDYMAGQQNDINFVLGSAIEFQQRQHEETVRRLEQRIAQLESRLGESPSNE